MFKSRKEFEEALIKAVQSDLEKAQASFNANQDDHDAKWTAAHPWHEKYATSSPKLHQKWRDSWNAYKKTGKILTHKESDLKD